MEDKSILIYSSPDSCIEDTSFNNELISFNSKHLPDGERKIRENLRENFPFLLWKHFDFSLVYVSGSNNY